MTFLSKSRHPDLAGLPDLVHSIRLCLAVPSINFHAHRPIASIVFNDFKFVKIYLNPYFLCPWWVHGLGMWMVKSSRLGLSRANSGAHFCRPGEGLGAKRSTSHVIPMGPDL
ncbi:hypothetical protein TNCV_3382841 [Trichonephila clavipes]|nr:hypothetical protein TNCV_3382841 [Trichonephila clavipes]